MIETTNAPSLVGSTTGGLCEYANRGGDRAARRGAASGAILSRCVHHAGCTLGDDGRTGGTAAAAVTSGCETCSSGADDSGAVDARSAMSSARVD